MNKEAIVLENYEQYQDFVKQDKPFILYFTTPSCNVCKAIYPKLMDLVKDRDIDVLKIDASVFTNITGQLLIFNVPTIVVMAEQKEFLREIRFVEFDKVERVLDILLT